MRSFRHIPRSLVGLLSVGMLAAACTPEETPVEASVVDGRGAPVALADPHLPTVSPIPSDLDIMPALPEHALTKAPVAPVEAPVDDSDLVITVLDALDEAPTAEGGLLGESRHALTGVVTPSRLSATGRRVNAGSSVIYQFNTTIADAVLVTTAGDADLYLENCNNSVVASSTLGGTSTDHAGFFSGNGVANCKQVRVRGFLNSTYNLYVYTYR